MWDILLFCPFYCGTERLNHLFTITQLLHSRALGSVTLESIFGTVTSLTMVFGARQTYQVPNSATELYHFEQLVHL